MVCEQVEITKESGRFVLNITIFFKIEADGFYKVHGTILPGQIEIQPHSFYLDQFIPAHPMLDNDLAAGDLVRELFKNKAFVVPAFFLFRFRFRHKKG